MYQIEFANKTAFVDSIEIESLKSEIDTRQVASKLFLKWEEHCVECAFPECYSKCILYNRRIDGACARFVYGIFPNKKFKGSYDFGADIQFKKWSKLEARLQNSYPIKLMSHDLETMLQFNQHYQEIEPFRIQDEFDAFVIECYAFYAEPFTFFIEYFLEDINGRHTKFRSAINLKFGYNFVSIPIYMFNFDKVDGYIYLYPENSDPEKRIVFTWLDFIKYKVNTKSGRMPQIPSQFIKCVAWDLDNTIWNGVLTESAKIELREGIIPIINKLDSMGIMQTIVSKNDHNEAIELLEHFGITKYFLKPQINWKAKSENLLNVAKELNIHIDSFAFIDDSTFEREEVKTRLPGVRVYSEQQVYELLSYSEFTIPKSNFSSDRRESYLIEEERTNNSLNFGSDYDSFIRSCKITVDLFIPENEQDKMRCWELIQRSNQLNLSMRRYNWKEYLQLYEKNDLVCLAIRAKDRFGEYGIVGFLTLQKKSKNGIIYDFVISCRAAQKKIEHSVVVAIASHLKETGANILEAEYVPGVKNGLMGKVFYELSFSTTYVSKSNVNFKLLLDRIPQFENLLELQISKTSLRQLSK